LKDRTGFPIPRFCYSDPGSPDSRAHNAEIKSDEENYPAKKAEIKGETIMPSFQHYIGCHRCGKKGVFDSHEGQFQCLFCGLFFEIEDKSSEGNPQYLVHEYEALGTYCIGFRNGPSQFGPYWSKFSISKFMKELENPDVDPDRSCLTKYDDKSKKVEYLFGSPERCFGLDKLLANETIRRFRFAKSCFPKNDAPGTKKGTLS
jgi:hypothetical protein